MEISIKWNICRACLKQNKPELKSLFNDAKFAKQIQDCTGTLIEANDGLPDKICGDCEQELEFAYQFVSKFKKSEKEIRCVVERTLSTSSCFGKRKNGEDDEVHFNETGGGDNSLTSRSTDTGNSGCLEYNPRKFVKSERSSSERQFDAMAFNDCDDSISNVDETTQDLKPNMVYQMEKEQAQLLENMTSTTTVLEESNSVCGSDDMETEYISASQDQDNCEQIESKQARNDFIIVISEDKRKKKKYEQYSVDNSGRFVECVTGADDDDATEHILGGGSGAYDNEHEEIEDGEECEHVNATNDNQIATENNVYLMTDLNNIENLIEEDHARANEMDDEDDIEETRLEEDNDGVSEATEDNIDMIDAKIQIPNTTAMARQRYNSRIISSSTTKPIMSAHICEVCGNCFSTRSLLKYHHRLHRNEKKYECELCYKRFTASSNLTAHMRIHTGEKPYECKFCGRRFTDRSTHIKHERIHTNERPFTCNICGKSFSLSNTLKAHEVVHSDEKPHKCMVCEKAFKLPHQLAAHMNTQSHKFLI